MKLELEARSQEVMRAVEALQEYARERRVPELTIFGLALALEESASNVVNHGLKHDPRQKFTVSFEHTGERFVIELRDPGPAFDPTQVPERPPVADHHDPNGGWGIQLVRRYTDQVQYRREAGENVVRLTKRLVPERS